MASNNELFEKLEHYRSKVVLSLQEISDLDVTCKSLLRRYLSNTELIDSSAVIKIQALLDYMYEQVNIGNWKEVKLYLRKTITITSYLKLIAHIKCSKNFSDDVIKESFKIIDIGLLFGCPLEAEPKLLKICASEINTKVVPSSNAQYALLSGISALPSELPTNAIHFNATPVQIIECPTMEYFFKNFIMTETPVILENCIDHWPAISKWTDQNYFINLAGFRTVSIELGSKYTDQDWTQKLMTIQEFIKSHIYEKEGPTGYLAQYQLFDQIPELRDDISEPEYCCFSESDEPVDINAWYGPKGTVSPLHHDPKRNLLAQVVGEKQVFLFSPTDSEYLYAHEHELLNNTAQVDPRAPDFVKYPKYKQAKPYYCVLRPGQMLFIPPKWWHFIESLSISFSVSFWWE